MPSYVPNLLTFFRILLIPAFVYAYFSTGPSEQKLIPMGIFILATASDVLDGYIARRFQLITKLGTALDPLADKLMLLTALGCLYIEQKIPGLVIVLVVAKEFFLIAAATYLYFGKSKAVIPANRYGKVTTGLFFALVVSVLWGWADFLQMTFMVLALLMTFVALSTYIKTYRRIHPKN